MKTINVLQNAKNSSFFKVHFKMRVLACLMVFFVLISPFYGIKKVKANPVAIGGSAIIGLILSGLAAQGLISGEYTVTAAQLTQINDLAQAQLALEGATAVAAAQKLGDALAAGAESAKIKALATGGTIWAFLKAVQEVLFPDRSIPEGELPTSIKGNLFATLGDYNFYCEVKDSALLAKAPFPVYHGWKIGNIASYGTELGYISKYEGISSYTSKNICFVYVLNTLTNKQSGYLYYDNGGGMICMWRDSAYDAAEFTPIMDALLNVSEVHQNAVYDNSYVSNLQHHDSVTVPTVLPQTIINNINTWDGTSDLVLAPPLPYDVPDDESLVVDPTYGGEVIDPTDPVDPPAEEEGISLPWLSALLALLGLGKLTGIDEGVLSGIDSIVDGITSTIQDVIEGVKTTAGEWATAATAAITTAISGIQSGISSIADTISHVFDPPSKDIDWDKLKSSGSVIFTKFPFSIPADLKFLVGLLVSDPQAPKWTVTVPFSIVGDWAQDGEFVLDFSVIDGFMVIVRNIELLAFIFGMVFMTRQLIWK